MLDNGKFSKSNEKFVETIRDTIITQALLENMDIYVDDTNFAPRHLPHLEELASSLNAKFQLIDMSDVSLEECLKRNSQRWPNVPPSVIVNMYNQFICREVHKSTLIPGLFECVICDIDGTLARAKERNLYDDLKAYEDDVRIEVLEALQGANRFGKVDTIFLTGRQQRSYDVTTRWLFDIANIDFPFDLFMRPDHDSRPDQILKREMYETHIKGKYNVKCVFDDRPKVIRMWRDLGLTVFDVGTGIEF